MKTFLALGLGLAAVSSPRATIFFDREADPFPFVDLTVILPVGSDVDVRKDVGLKQMLPDILEGGTAKLSRADFFDRIAEFGATYDVSVTNEFSFVKISYPIVPKKKMDGLVALLSEAWKTPRFDDETYKIARTKLEASIRSSLDSDQTLATSSARRFLSKNVLGTLPLFIEDLGHLDLSRTQSVYETEFLGVPNVWAGFIGPESEVDNVKKLLTAMFSKQGSIQDGPHLERLRAPKALAKKPKTYKKILIVDKADRSQTYTAFIGARPSLLSPQEELPFLFSHHIMVFSGLNSVWGEVLRTKGGFSYAVMSPGYYQLGFPVMGVVSNPIREKTADALRAIANTAKAAYDTGKVYANLSASEWGHRERSFRYGEILDRSSSSGRLSKRISVLTGALSPELYARDPATWKIDPKEVEKLISGIWKESSRVLSVVGKAADLRGPVSKAFPGYDIQVVPFQQVISEKSY